MATSQIAINIAIITFIDAIFVFIVALLITQKYLEKRQKATGYLACSIFFWSFTCLMSAIIYYNSFSLADGKIIQIFIYGGTFTGTIFTYMFARKVLFTEKSTFYRYYILLGIIAILIIGFTESSNAVPFPDSIDHLAFILKTEFSLILVFYLVPTYITILWVAFRTARKMEERQYRVGFRMIGIGNVLILVVFIFDTLAGLFMDSAFYYGLFMYIQWITVSFATFFSYVGWILPGWFRKLFKIESPPTANPQNP